MVDIFTAVVTVMEVRSFGDPSYETILVGTFATEKAALTAAVLAAFERNHAQYPITTRFWEDNNRQAFLTAYQAYVDVVKKVDQIGEYEDEHRSVLLDFFRAANIEE